MSSIGRAISIEGVISVTVVCNHNYLVAVSLSGLNNSLYTLINSLNSLIDSIPDTGVAHHITISEVECDEVKLLLSQLCNKCILNLVCAHLGFKVVGSNLGRRDKNSLLTLELILTATIEEEGNVCILLSLCNTQLAQAKRRHILTNSHLYIILVKEDVQTGKLIIVGSQTAVVQRQSVHTLLRHILLSKNNSKLLSTVVTEVEEDNYIIRLNQTDRLIILHCNDRLHKLIGHTCIIRCLHSSDHIGSVLTYAINKLVVSNLHTLPTFVTVHSVVATNNRGNLTTGNCQVVGELLDKALTTLRVGITTIHKAVNKRAVSNAKLLCQVAELKEVVERRVNTAIRNQTHKVNLLAICSSILKCGLNLCIILNRAITASTVNLYQVLIYNTTCTNIEVTYLRVTHLALGQTHIFAIGTQLSVRIFLSECVNIIGLSRVDNITLGVVTIAPAIKNHQ